MKIRENDSAHELAKILQVSSKFHFILFIYFDDLHLQITERISFKASADNSSAQRANILGIYFFTVSRSFTIDHEIVKKKKK